MALCIAVRETAFPYAWIRNGLIMGIAGVAGALIGFEGTAWIALTEGASRHPIPLARLMSPILENEKATRCRLITAVHEDDKIAIRFVEWCGFHHEGEHAPGFSRYAWDRD